MLTPIQKTIVKDNHRFRVLNIGRRGGKTTLAIKEIRGLALYKSRRIAYIAPTYQQARDIAWEILKKELGNFIIGNVNESRLEVRTYTKQGGESLIILRGWESIETLRGQAFDFLVIDEVAMMRGFWINWHEVLRPTLTDRKGGVLFISTPKGYNHFYDLCNQELTDKDFKTFHFTSWDNPFLPREELETAKRTLPPERFLQEYEASFQKTTGLVYKEFSRELHLYDEMWKGRYKLYAGIDFGFRNPACILDGYFDSEHLWIEDEWYKRERTDSQLADYAAQTKYDGVIPDPENQRGIEELRMRKLNVLEVSKGKGSVENGINLVRQMFITRKLHINKKCVNLIAELESYSHDEDNPDKNESEKPIKKNDHACDALRYLVMRLLPIAYKNELMAFESPIYRQPKASNPGR